MNAPELTGRQRRHLRGLANPLRAQIQVGDGGVSDGVIQALRDALERHELVKVRLRQPEDKKRTAVEIAAKCNAALCGVVGHTVILYRPDKDSPGIQLPKAGD